MITVKVQALDGELEIGHDVLLRSSNDYKAWYNQGCDTYILPYPRQILERVLKFFKEDYEETIDLLIDHHEIFDYMCVTDVVINMWIAQITKTPINFLSFLLSFDEPSDFIMHIFFQLKTTSRELDIKDVEYLREVKSTKLLIEWIKSYYNQWSVRPISRYHYNLLCKFMRTRNELVNASKYLDHIMIHTVENHLPREYCNYESYDMFFSMVKITFEQRDNGMNFYTYQSDYDSYTDFTESKGAHIKIYNYERQLIRKDYICEGENCYTREKDDEAYLSVEYDR